MASAKFLEEALSTDVDESAVSAIVGSLETQLGAGPQSSGGLAPQQPAQPPSAASAPSQTSSTATTATTTPTTQPLLQAQQQTQQQQAQLQQQAQPQLQQQANHQQSNGAPTSSPATTATAPACATPASQPAASSAQSTVLLQAVKSNEAPASQAPQLQAQSQPQQSQLQPPPQQHHQQHVANGTAGSESSSDSGGGGGGGGGGGSGGSSSGSNGDGGVAVTTSVTKVQMVNSVSATASPSQELASQKPPTPAATPTPMPVTSSSIPIQVIAAGQQVQAMQSQPQTQPQQQQQQPVQSVQVATQPQHQQPPQQQQQQFVAQVTSNQVVAGAGQPGQITALAKVQGEHVKIVYPGTGQVITGGVVNANNKITFPAQSVAQLANGALGVVTTQTVLQSAGNTGAAGNVASGPQVTGNQQQQQPQPQQAQQQLGVNKQTALVIKTSGAPAGMVSVPISSVPVSVGTGVASVAQAPAQQQPQQQAQPGKPAGAVTSALVPSNVQILNVNAVRPGTPVTGQQASKQVSRVVFAQSQHMMAGRAGTPGITLQALQSLQAAGQGQTLILKSENGIRFLTLAPQGAQIANNSITPGNATATAAIAVGPGGTTYRVSTLPTTVAPTVTTTTVTPVTSTIVAATTTAPTTTAPTVQPTPAPAQPARSATDNNTKEKCRKFLANLLELSSREPKQVERNVRILIQELIDCKVEPETFCERLEKLLNASPQPCLIGFLKKSLPLLRQSLVTQEMTIEGVRPPPVNVVFSLASAAPILVQSQTRTVAGTSGAGPAPTQVVTSPATVVASPTASTQVRVMAPLTGVTNVPRPPQPMIPQRLNSEKPATSSVNKKMRPVTTMVRPPMTTYAIKSPVVQQQLIHQPPQQIQSQPQLQHQQPQQMPQLASVSTGVSGGTTTTTIRHPTTGGPIVVQKATPATSAANKTMVLPTQNKSGPSANAATAQNKISVPSAQPKAPVIKQEKEKKTFSSAGYTGDDDINDVAAMGGVNLAEESQRILGSTKFVGTQIRSCKDEVFLHMTPLQQKINKIVTSYGLEEPNQEVASLISHAAQERLKNLVEKLAIIAEHRIDLVKVDPRYEITQDVRSQLKFLEELDRVERKRHEEQERETLLKAAKSRAKTEDPEQAKLKAKAKEMQRAEMEEARQREANQTALQAIGPRKKPKLELGAASTNSTGSAGGLGAGGMGFNRQMPMRPRLKRVNFRDLLFLLEQEKETCRSTTLYKSYLK